MFGRASHNGLLPAGLSAVLLTVPFRRWRGITSAKNSHWRNSRTLLLYVAQKVGIARQQKEYNKCKSYQGNRNPIIIHSFFLLNRELSHLAYPLRAPCLSP